MPKRGRNPTEPNEPVRLRVPRAEADTKIGEQITKGEELLQVPIQSYGDYEAVQSRFFTWNEYCRSLLKALFTTEELFYEFASSGPFSIKGEPSLGERVSDLRDDIRGDVRKLVSIRARLDLYAEPGTFVTAPASPSAFPDPTVFIVHGRDGGVKETVARMIERLGLKTVILHELPDEGRTLIEKFEQESSGAAFAVVLLTPDDVGALAEEAQKLQRRARQNVILELGFFFGKLGRRNVRALHVEGVELPSDLAGYIYIPLDSNEHWKLTLGREMKAAGLPVDLNRLV